MDNIEIFMVVVATFVVSVMLFYIIKINLDIIKYEKELKVIRKRINANYYRAYKIRKRVL